jgi:uncharacterized repeat protein (TIGR03837 family)
MVSTPSAAVPRWDIHCRVVDNYGDAAVCFRLARALALEHGLSVRLLIDQPRVLAALRPELCPERRRQWLEGVEVVDRAHAPADGVAAVTIDAFGGGLDATQQQALASRRPPGLWIVLEYLTAEPFAARLHAMPSPPPSLAIPRWFFFPGFDAGTGGLLRERGLIAARDAFQADPGHAQSLLGGWGVPPRPEGAWRVSLFTYPAQAALPPLLAGMAAGPVPVQLLAAPGPAAAAVSAWAGSPLPSPGAGSLQRGRLQAVALPFVAQDDYDRLLWSCDLNVVRGEDSFVRAQWAARPMLWRPYPQPDGADRIKGQAFLDRYLAQAPAAAATALRALHAPWLDAAAGSPSAWSAILAEAPALRAHARAWAAARAAEPDLATRLVTFCREKLQ